MVDIHLLPCFLLSLVKVCDISPYTFLMFLTQLTIKHKTYNQNCETMADAEGVFEKPVWETLRIFGASGKYVF